MAIKVSGTTVVNDSGNIENITTINGSDWNTIVSNSSAGAAAAVSTLSDVTLGTLATGEVLQYNGSAWVNTGLNFTDIAGTLADAQVVQSNVTQHQAALSITESQISDLGSYQTADATILKSADIGVSVQAFGAYEPADSTILKDADIGVNVEAFDSTILKDADIGVTVEARDATILKNADIGVTVQGPATTLAGYGITNANTSAETDTAIATAIGNLINSAPAALDTLDELAAALGDDANFAATMTTSLAGKEPADSTILKDADIGVNVQAFGSYEAADSTILKDADIGVNVQAFGSYETADATILKDADIGVNVQAFDATIVVDADIGVSVQGFDANLVSDATYVKTDENFTTADHSKLDGIELLADVTDATNVTAAGALMDSEVTNLAAVKAFDTADYATAAQGALASSALQSYTVTEGDVTGHQAALSITESQISDLNANYVVDATYVKTDENFTTADHSKLDLIEASATADQTGAEIKSAYEAEANAFTDAQFTKLGAIEALADVTDATNVEAAGALMDSEITNLADVKAFDPADYATAATGTAALPKAGGDMTGNTTHGDDVKSVYGDSADLEIYHDGSNSLIKENGTGSLKILGTNLQLQSSAGTNFLQAVNSGVVTLFHAGAGKLSTNASGVGFTGNITVTGTVDGRDIDADGTKLDGVEALADVTDTTNVVAALSAGTNVTITAGGEISSVDTNYVSSDFTHDDLTGYVAAEHVDWAGASAGTIHLTNLPATALTSVQTAVSQAAQLALTAQEGDVVVRSDENKTYMHNGGTAGTMADFTLLATPTDSVTSVDGATGVITLNHDSLTGFVANEHIDWTTDQGATNINTANYVNTVYTHPTHPGDDAAVDTGALTGATVISDLDFNVTTDTLGHVTDANATVATRTLTLANLGYTGATNANNSVTNATHTGEVTGSGALTIASNVVDADNLKVTGNGTTAQFLRSDGDGSFTWATPTDTNTVYTHPTHAGDDMAVDTGALTGATVISDLDFNVTTDTLGHVTDANATVATRTLTLANLGYTGATNANNSTSNATHTGEVTGSGALTVADNVIDAGNLKVTGNGTTAQYLRSDADGSFTWATPTNTVYTHPTFNGDDFSLDTGALSGATVISDIDINVTTDTNGHVTDANGTVATRTLTLANLGYTGATNANNTVTNATHTGEVTGSGALTIANNVVDEANLKVSNAPTNGYYLQAQSGNTGGMTWAEVSGGDARMAFGGTGAAASATGEDSIAIGDAATTNKAGGIAIGDGAYANALHNISIGTNSGHITNTGNATFGGDSVHIGNNARTDTGTGAFNVAIGSYSRIRANHDNCVALGFGADCKENGNISIGYYSAAKSVNCITIGSEVESTTANQVRIGTSSHTSVSVGNTSSDIRDKTEVEDLTLGLEFINKVRPVTFVYNNRDRYKDGDNSDESKKNDFVTTGIVAQEVVEALTECGFDKQHKIIRDTHGEYGDLLEKEYLEVDISQFIAPLMQAVKELSAKNDALEARLDAAGL